jgi:hypothetical protein
MWFKRKSDVLCSKCGFLGWRTEYPDGSGSNGPSLECYWRARQEFQDSKFTGVDKDLETGNLDILSCRALQWSLIPGTTNPDRGWLSADLIRKPRECLYYIDYQAGFSPDEHKELKRDNFITQATFRASLVGALIGSIAAIIAAIIGGLIFVFTRD